MRTITKVGAVALTAFALATGAAATAVATETNDHVYMEWYLPKDVNPNTAPFAQWFPQTAAVQKCVWVQRDKYRYATATDRAIVDALDDDGLLTMTNGTPEDARVYVSHTFTAPKDCETATVTPTPTVTTSTPTPTVTTSTPTPTVTTATPTPTVTTSTPTATSTASVVPTPATSTTPPRRPVLVQTDFAEEELAQTGSEGLLWVAAAGAGVLLLGGGLRAAAARRREH